MEVEAMNDELAKFTVETKNESDTSKKNSKKDIIKRIFEVCEKNNFKISDTEQQLSRKTRKKLLEILGGYIEQSVENKIKSGHNNIPPDCQGSPYASQLPVLKLCHGFLASLVEKGFNSGCSYLEYEYELKEYAKACNESMMIDDCLLEIAEEYGPELFSFIGNPYSRLLFIHATSVMSCLHKIDKTVMKSPRFKIDEIKI